MYYLYNSLVPLNMSVEPGPKFQAPAPLFNVFGSGSSHPKLLGLRLHSPAYDAVNYYS